MRVRSACLLEGGDQDAVVRLSRVKGTGGEIYSRRGDVGAGRCKLNDLCTLEDSIGWEAMRHGGQAEEVLDAVLEPVEGANRADAPGGSLVEETGRNGIGSVDKKGKVVGIHSEVVDLRDCAEVVGMPVWKLPRVDEKGRK